MMQTPVLASSAIVERNGKILLIKRKYEPGIGKWALPGGIVEYGETVEETAVREVKEETGVDIKLERLLGVYNLMVKDEIGNLKKQFVIVCFLSKGLTENLKPDKEVADASWFKPEEIWKLPLVSTTILALKDAGY